MTTYTVEEHPDAVIVRGSVPIDTFNHLIKLASARGIGRMHPGLAQAMGASFVFVSAAGEARLTAAVEAKNADKDAITRWRRGPHTGLSSIALLDALRGNRRTTHYPHDPDDFARCRRMLEETGLRDRLPTVRDALPHPWPALIDAWERMEALYDEEAPSRSCPKLYALMRSIIEGKP
jgi:hypothetical protein